jgi:HAD superfamily hydrolase (TIGR01459 family)
MHHLTGFGPLAAQYDGFILDLWGVIHDGVTPYPGAADCLRALRDAGKPVVLLSNAPRRAAVAAKALRAMGIGDELYTGIMTSGEATHLALSNPAADPWFARLGPRVFHLGPERDRNVIDGLPLVRVETPGEADFVVNTGPDDLGSQTEVADFFPVLEACRAAGLPMICANPDLEVIRGGVRVICAGALAQHYARLGGDVRWLGKPDAAIYAPVLAMLGVDRTRVLAVGDALRTDIAGADSAGIDSCWVLGGIHGAELGGDPHKIEAAAAAAGLSPVACLPGFVW